MTYATEEARLAARKETNRKSYVKHREKRIAEQNEYRQKNKDSCTAAVAAWNSKNKEHVRAWHAAYRKKKLSDPYYRLRKNLARRMLLALKSKSQSTYSLIGCTPQFLREWLESKFKEGMTWENYGPVWHVDHKKPMALFDLNESAQQAEACNYRNLQPLFAKDNISKSDKYEETRE